MRFILPVDDAAGLLSLEVKPSDFLWIRPLSAHRPALTSLKKNGRATIRPSCATASVALADKFAAHPLAEHFLRTKQQLLVGAL